jgi:hypothetical protein
MMRVARLTSEDEEIEKRGDCFNGTEFIISRRRWLHVLDRHAELAGMTETLEAAASSPDEVFLDPHGTLHMLRRLSRASDDSVVLIARRRSRKPIY